jgi:fructokinase
MIVSCGEALIDFLPATTADGTPAYVPRPGGSPFNVAIGIGRLGAPAGFFGAISGDAFGATLHAALAESGVDRSYVARSERPTTLAFVTAATAGPLYTFFDEGSAGRMLTEMDLPAFTTAVTALHFGSLSLATEPCGSAYEALMQRERPDRVISLDPNVRAALVKNRDGYVARIERMVAMSDIVRVSDADLDYLAPDGSFDAVAGRWLAAGVKLVVLSKGAAGAEARGLSAGARVAARPVTVVDDVGAGDAFTAALLVHLSQGGHLDKRALARLDAAGLRNALEFASAAAALSVSRAGADPPWRRELA